MLLCSFPFVVDHYWGTNAWRGGFAVEVDCVQALMRISGISFPTARLADAECAILLSLTHPVPMIYHVRGGRKICPRHPLQKDKTNTKKRRRYCTKQHRFVKLQFWSFQKGRMTPSLSLLSGSLFLDWKHLLESHSSIWKLFILARNTWNHMCID